MKVAVHNFTTDSISCQHLSLGEDKPIGPYTQVFLDLNIRGPVAHSAPQRHVTLIDSKDKLWTIKLDWFRIRMGVRWNIIFDEGPWRIYRSEVEQGLQKLHILPRRDMSDFLSYLPDSLPLSSLTLPGTHDTLAFYGWPIAQCQTSDTPLSEQLQSGIRVIDIRLALVNSELIAYHDVFPQKARFQEILAMIHQFLTDTKTCRETVIMSLKQEDFRKTPPPTFSARVHDEIYNGPGGRDMWFLDNRVPTLGEVRGKVIMFSRFGGDGSGWDRGLEGLGIHPTSWPDSERTWFTWPCKNTMVRTQDWYAIPSFLDIPEKVKLSTEILLPPSPDRPPVSTLSITYFSASSFPLALPQTCARGFGWPQYGLGVEGINSRIGNWLLDTLTPCSSGSGGDGSRGFSEKNNAKTDDVRLRGWALMDFYTYPYDNGLVPLLVECNFRGRRSGEEGWP